jgi:spore coat protein CotF
MNRDFLKEAIADAKAVKESAIANAKVALEEAFTPQLRSMLARRLEEMEDMDEAEDVDEGYDEVSRRNG